MRPDPDTAATHVHARFVVDGSTGDWLRRGARLSGDFAIGAAEWDGELRLDAEGSRAAAYGAAGR